MAIFLSSDGRLDLPAVSRVVFHDQNIVDPFRIDRALSAAGQLPLTCAGRLPDLGDIREPVWLLYEM